MNTFRSAGDRGDCIFSMPAMRFLGGGVLYLEAANYTRVRLTPDNWCGLDTLLKRQPYVSDVREWRGERVGVCLNDFRAHMFRALRNNLNPAARQKSLVDWICETHNVPLEVQKEPWLTVEPNKIARVVISRSGPDRPGNLVYHNPLFPWRRVWEKYRDAAVFVGTASEHAVFCDVVGSISHYVTPTLDEAAQAIAGCDLFIGNQNCPHAIAEGLKKNILLEVWREGANCLFYRQGVTHGWDLTVQLPEL